MPFRSQVAGAGSSRAVAASGDGDEALGVAGAGVGEARRDGARRSDDGVRFLIGAVPV